MSLECCKEFGFSSGGLCSEVSLYMHKLGHILKPVVHACNIYMFVKSAARFFLVLVSLATIHCRTLPHLPCKF